MHYILIDAVGVRVEMHHEVTSILKNGIKLRYSLPAACMIIFHFKEEFIFCASRILHFSWFLACFRAFSQVSFFSTLKVKGLFQTVNWCIVGLKRGQNRCIVGYIFPFLQSHDASNLKNFAIWYKPYAKCFGRMVHIVIVEWLLCINVSICVIGFDIGKGSIHRNKLLCLRCNNSLHVWHKNGMIDSFFYLSWKLHYHHFCNRILFYRQSQDKQIEDKIEDVQEKLGVAISTLQQAIGGINEQVNATTSEVSHGFHSCGR